MLQADAYGAYASHERKHENVVRVGCWAHARRYFHEALDERAHGKDPLSYPRDVLTRLPAMTNRDDLTPLTPAGWKPS